MYIQCKQESIIRIMFSYFVLWALYYVALSSKEECWQNGNSNQLGSFIFPWSWYAMILGKIKVSVSNKSLRTRNFMWKFFVEVPQKLPLLGKTWSSVDIQCNWIIIIVYITYYHLNSSHCTCFCMKVYCTQQLPVLIYMYTSALRSSLETSVPNPLTRCHSCLESSSSDFLHTIVLVPHG